MLEQKRWPKNSHFSGVSSLNVFQYFPFSQTRTEKKTTTHHFSSLPTRPRLIASQLRESPLIAMKNISQATKLHPKISLTRYSINKIPCKFAASALYALLGIRLKHREKIFPSLSPFGSSPIFIKRHIKSV